MPFGHWTFLRILWQQDGLTQRELSDEAGVMEPTTFTAIRAMEQLGYVSRRQIADNRKNVYIHLTPKGRALEGKLVPLAEEVNAIALRGIPTEDVAAMRRALVAILENLDGDVPGRASARRPSKRRNAARARRTHSPPRMRRNGAKRRGGRREVS